MTTSVKIHVNGRYLARVTQNQQPPIIVHGNYEGSPNPSGEHVFSLRHDEENNFRITEEQAPAVDKTQAELEHRDDVVETFREPTTLGAAHPAPPAAASSPKPAPDGLRSTADKPK